MEKQWKNCGFDVWPLWSRSAEIKPWKKRAQPFIRCNGRDSGRCIWGPSQPTSAPFRFARCSETKAHAFLAPPLLDLLSFPHPPSSSPSSSHPPSHSPGFRSSLLRFNCLPLMYPSLLAFFCSSDRQGTQSLVNTRSYESECLKNYARIILSMIAKMLFLCWLLHDEIQACFERGEPAFDAFNRAPSQCDPVGFMYRQTFNGHLC